MATGISKPDYSDSTYLDSAIRYDTSASIIDVTLSSGTMLTISGSSYFEDFVEGTTVYCYGVEDTYELNNRAYTLGSGTAVSGTTYKRFEIYDLSGETVDSQTYGTYVSGTGTLERYTTTISGLEHLEGNTVGVISEGAIHPDVVVTSGTITLQYPVKNAEIGYKYTSYLQSMPLEVGNDYGASIGRDKKVTDVYIRLHKSLGVKCGPTIDNLDDINFRTSEDAMDSAVALYTGDKRFHFNQGWTKYLTITVASEDPLPMTVLAICPSQLTAPK